MGQLFGSGSASAAGGEDKKDYDEQKNHDELMQHLTAMKVAINHEQKNNYDELLQSFMAMKVEMEDMKDSIHEIKATVQDSIHEIKEMKDSVHEIKEILNNMLPRGRPRAGAISPSVGGGPYDQHEGPPGL